VPGNSGAFDTDLSDFRPLELVEGKGELRAEAFFA
jgi:hypothetical protein